MNHTASQSEQQAVSVSLISGAGGADRVSITLANGQSVVMTPAQARGLATTLIGAVNRAEVKASLHVSNNLWRRLEDDDKRLSTVAG